MRLFRKRKSKFFWYDFMVRGKRYRGSTKETKEQRASKIAGLKLAQAIEGSDPLDRKAPVLRQFSQRFLEWVKKSKLERKTQMYYENGWRLLSGTSIAGMRLDQITRDRVEALSFPGSAGNTNCGLRTLRRMLHKAEEWELIRRVPKFRLAKEHERSLNLDEAAEKRVLEGAADCKWHKRTFHLFKDVVFLMRDTGMRNERELYRARIEYIDWNNRVIFVPDSKTPSGRRTVPLSDRAIEVLRRRCGGRREGWVFPSKRSKAGHLTTMAHRFREARRKAGLPEELVLYCGRHDYGTRVMRQTGNLKAVMLTMGHKDVKTAMRYQHPEVEIVRQALNQLGASNQVAATA